MNKANIKKLGVTVMLISSLAVGAVVANAQEGAPPVDRPGEPGMGFMDGRPGGRPGGEVRGERGGRFGGEHEIYLLQAVMDATGLNLVEITQQLRGGTMLGEIVTANGGTIEAVVADAVADVTTEINEQVTAGQLTQEQADQLLERLENAYTTILTGEARDQAVDRLMDVGIVRLAAEMAELNPREIMQQLRSGSTLSSILTDNGVDVAAFVAEATERAQARVDLQVAEDRITAEQAAELMTQFTEQLNTLLNTATADA